MMLLPEIWRWKNGRFLGPNRTSAFHSFDKRSSEWVLNYWLPKSCPNDISVIQQKFFGSVTICVKIAFWDLWVRVPSIPLKFFVVFWQLISSKSNAVSSLLISLNRIILVGLSNGTVTLLNLDLNKWHQEYQRRYEWDLCGKLNHAYWWILICSFIVFSKFSFYHIYVVTPMTLPVYANFTEDRVWSACSVCSELLQSSVIIYGGLCSFVHFDFLWCLVHRIYDTHAFYLLLGLERW